MTERLRSGSVLSKAAVAGSIAGLALALTASCSRPESTNAQDSTVSQNTITPPTRCAPGEPNIVAPPIFTPVTPKPGETIPEGQAIIRFNYLGACSEDIFVYRGPGTADADRTRVGSYRNDEVMPVECQVPDGRDVHSVTPEAPRESSLWFKLALPNSGPQYATAVYADYINTDVPLKNC